MNASSIDRAVSRVDPALSFYKVAYSNDKSGTRWRAIFSNGSPTPWVGTTSIYTDKVLGKRLNEKTKEQWISECLEFGAQVRREYGLPSHHEWLNAHPLYPDWKSVELVAVEALSARSRTILTRLGHATLGDVAIATRKREIDFDALHFGRKKIDGFGYKSQREVFWLIRRLEQGRFWEI